jgi:hypothetical protein
MLVGDDWADASVVGVPPAMGTFMTVPLPEFVQYTFEPSTAMLCGAFWPEARVVGLDPSSPAFMTEPIVLGLLSAVLTQ